MTDGMNLSLEYAQFIAIVSAITFATLILHLVKAILAYRYYHDERAAFTLVKAVGLVVMSFGVLISAIALLLEDPQISVAGLSIARGALLMVALTLLFADVKPPMFRNK